MHLLGLNTPMKENNFCTNTPMKLNNYDLLFCKQDVH
jgi:hypothetical protein